MMKLLSGGGRARSDVYTLFEPCHIGDKADFANCTEEMRALLQCDFSKVERLVFQERDGSTPSSAKSHEECSAANFRVFKTIHMHDFRVDVLPLFRVMPELRVVVLVRDPRAIYVSAKKRGMVSRSMESLIPANVLSLKEDSDVTLQFIEYLCGKFVDYASLEEEHVIKVRFEDMIRSSAEVERVINFFGFTLDTHWRRTLADVFPPVPDLDSQLVTINHINTNWNDVEKKGFNLPVCRSAFRLWNYA